MSTEEKKKNEKRFFFTWFIPKPKREKIIKYINEKSKEELMASTEKIMEKWFKYEVVGIDNIPKEGSVICAMNHCSIIDPAIMIKFQREAIFVANKKLWGDPVFKPILDKFNCIELDKKNPAAGISSYRQVLEALNNEHIMVIFPEGTRMGLKKKKPIQDGVGRFAVRSNSPVVPIFILYKRKPLGLLIPHFTKIKVVIGKPYTYEGNKDIKGSGQVAITEIYKLKEEAEELLSVKPRVKVLRPNLYRNHIHE